MSTIELREMLLEKISAIEDDELLHEIAHLIDFEPKITNGVYIMSPGEIEAVNEGLEQLKNGQWVSHEEANREIDEWLEK
jgi:hypothetical protein